MQKLVKMALEELEFAGNKKEAAQARREFVENTDVFDSGHFFDVLLLQPKTRPRRRDRGARAVHVNVTERTPLANLYFMRDQQAVTDRGNIPVPDVEAAEAKGAEDNPLLVGEPGREGRPRGARARALLRGATSSR